MLAKMSTPGEPKAFPPRPQKCGQEFNVQLWPPCRTAESTEEAAMGKRRG